MAEHEFILTFSQAGAERVGDEINSTIKGLDDLEKRATKVARTLGTANKAVEKSEGQALAAARKNAVRRAKLAEDTATKLRRIEEIRAEREIERARKTGEDIDVLRELQAKRRAEIEERVAATEARAREREARAREKAAQEAVQLELRNAELRARALEDRAERELALLDVKHRRELASARRHGADVNALAEAHGRERVDLTRRLEDKVGDQVEETQERVRDLYKEMGKLGESMEDALKPMDDFTGGAGKLRAVFGGVEDMFKVISGVAVIELVETLIEAWSKIKQVWDDWTGQTERIENAERRREASLKRLAAAAEEYRAVLAKVDAAEESAFGYIGVLDASQRGQLIKLEQEIRQTEKALNQVIADIDAGGEKIEAIPLTKAGNLLAQARQKGDGTSIEQQAREREGQARRLREQAREHARRGRGSLAAGIREEAAKADAAAKVLRDSLVSAETRVDQLDARRERLKFDLVGLDLARQKLIADAKKLAATEGLGSDAPKATNGPTAPTPASASTPAPAPAEQALSAVNRTLFNPRYAITQATNELAAFAEATALDYGDRLSIILADALAPVAASVDPGPMLTAALDEAMKLAPPALQAYGARLSEQLAAESARIKAVAEANRDREIALIADPIDREETSELEALARRYEAEYDLAVQNGEDLLLLRRYFEAEELRIVEEASKKRVDAAKAERDAQIEVGLAAAGGMVRGAQAAKSLAKTAGASRATLATVERAMQFAEAAKAGAEGIAAAKTGDALGVVLSATQAAAHIKAATKFEAVPGTSGGGGAPSIPSAGARGAAPAPKPGDLGGAANGRASTTINIVRPLRDSRALRDDLGEVLSEVGDGQIIIDREAS